MIVPEPSRSFKIWIAWNLILVSTGFRNSFGTEIPRMDGFSNHQDVDLGVLSWRLKRLFCSPEFLPLRELRRVVEMVACFNATNPRTHNKILNPVTKPRLALREWCPHVCQCNPLMCAPQPIPTPARKVNILGENDNWLGWRHYHCNRHTFGLGVWFLKTFHRVICQSPSEETCLIGLGH